MATDNKPLHNMDTAFNSGAGGSCRITIPVGTQLQAGQPDTNGEAQAGVSQPCLMCWLIAATSVTTARVRIGAACTATTGTPVVAGQYLPIKIDDLNLLYFYGTSGDIVDIGYRN